MKKVSLNYYIAIVPATCFLSVSPASAQGLNYDNLSSLEEPLAFEIGKATVEVTGLVDVPVMLEVDESIFNGDADVSFTTNAQVSAEMRLGNRWDIGAVYFGQYSEQANHYSDNVAGYVSTSWGTIIGGNVGGLARENTRRRRGVGNAALAFDDFYGQLARWGGGYQGRFGPVVASAIVDEKGDFEIGAAFQRPIGNKDYRVTSRLRRSSYLAADGQTQLTSEGVGLVGELVYGSSLFDLGIGYERLDGALLDVDRLFVSAGAQHKVGSLSLSAAGHYGRLGATNEYSSAFGVGYDIARGISTNFGFNARRARLEQNGVNIVDEDEQTATASVRYSF